MLFLNNDKPTNLSQTVQLLKKNKNNCYKYLLRKKTT